ncbi:hypothetical protein Tsubulata_017831 [Turnera subulata]|uniref:Misato Segment II tubulin-like domain-containing protein n=1 Tax=Turnera subulata TaxID=218843 RepID=A0A9Q0J536_9ROSI|nr:hypothetical protein Tsubulata_017831 [Turnera subulata]
MRELVTVQVGGFANFIGSHFWNFQDELLGLAADPESDPVYKNQMQHLNMDTLYRSGETEQGVLTYTPRLLSIDSQGSLGCVSSRGGLYNSEAYSSASTSVATWKGSVSTHISEPRKKNVFLQSLYEEEQSNGIDNAQNDNQRKFRDQDIVESLERDVEHWTDFSKVHYHPQSLYELSGLWVDTQQTNNYGIGKEIFCEGLRGEEISERLRFFVEECDHIQGFQFVVDDSGCFSALAADFLEVVADEYSNTPVLLYTVRGSGSHTTSISRQQTISRSIYDAVSFSRLSSFCKVIVPIGLPSLSKRASPFKFLVFIVTFYNVSLLSIVGEGQASSFLCIKDEKPYHSSSIYAAALHSMSLPFRMEPPEPAVDLFHVSGGLDVNGIVQILAGQARQNMVAILDVAMPAPPIDGEMVEQSLLEHLQPLTPEVSSDAEDPQAVESMTVHGALGSGGRQVSVSEVTKSVNANYEHAPIRPKFCHLSVAFCPLPIPLPFPKIFGNHVGQHGEILSRPIAGSSRGSLDVHSIPMAARLRSSNAVLPFLENRLGNLRRFALRQGAPGTELVRSWGFGKDELEDMEETLSKMVSTLDDRAQISSDSD